MVGAVLVKLAFVASICSTLFYALAIRRRDSVFPALGRRAYQGTVLAVLGVAAFLLHIILTHQFQYTYVWSYSSRDLSLPLLVSTFYAGQEGSFALWALFTVLIGVFLLRDAARKAYEPEVMAVYAALTTSLVLFLLVKDPFLRVWETWPGQVAPGLLPADGRGLNPLLQNYWMVIHPQVLFGGFAAMGVPYAYAMAGLLKRDYTSWIRPATPWLVLGALVLGSGIMMGGFWAYETLGWGGYWAWDPVENSSLVPWLICVAAIHSMLIQRKTGRFVRTNIVLSSLSFLMVLYSTFLTRSGVLGDTSVHSFVDPGTWVYRMLIGTIAAFALLAGVLLARRWKEIPRPKVEHSPYSREFALFLGSGALVAAAILITLGTSSPVITGILSGKKSAMDISYYVNTGLPLGVIIALLSGLGQLLWWSRTGRKDFLKVLLVPAGLALVAAVVLSALAWAGVLVSAFLFAAAFSLFANLQVAARIWKANPGHAGGAAAHVGVAIMFLGFVASSEYDRTEKAMLHRGLPVEVLGYTLTYRGYRMFENEKYAFKVEIEKGGRRHEMEPVMYQSSYTEGLIRNPDIVNLMTHDFYLAPLGLESEDSLAGGGMEQSSLAPGETECLGSVRLTFLGLSRPLFSFASGGGGQLRDLEAALLVRRVGGKPEIVRFRYRPESGWKREQRASGEERSEITLLGLETERGGSPVMRVGVRDLPAQQAPSRTGEDEERDVLFVEASVKPLINLVWAGVIILLTGLIVTIVRRAQEASYRKAPAP